MNCSVHPSLSMQPFQNSIQHRRPFGPSWLCQPEIIPFPHWFCHIPNIPTQILPHIMRFTLGQLTCQPQHCWDVGGYWVSWRRWWGLEQVSYNRIEWWGKFEGQTGSLLFLFSYVLMLKPTQSQILQTPRSQLRRSGSNLVYQNCKITASVTASPCQQYILCRNILPQQSFSLASIWNTNNNHRGRFNHI